MQSCPPLTLEKPRQAIGIDIANLDFKASIGKEHRGADPVTSKAETFGNTIADFSQLIDWIKEKKVDPNDCFFVMEATGVYYEALAVWLCNQGYSVAVLLPNKAAAFAKSLNIKSKDDDIDARMLAHMGCERTLKSWKPAPADLKELKQLTRLRESLVNQQTMVKNQLHASKKEFPASPKVIAYHKATINHLSQTIKKISQDVNQLIKNDDQLHQNFKFIVSIPGLGAVTAAVLLAETQGFHLFLNQAQLVSYAGYDVVRRQSGTSIKYKEKISKKGNHRIRKALYFPAFVASKHIPVYGELYERVNTQNAKTKMKGAVALQRKLLVLAYHLVKNQQYFDPSK